MVTGRMKLTTVGLALAFGLAAIGCSSSLSDEQMRQLNDLKAEVASLEQQIPAKEKEKADLEKQIAEKNSRLQNCAADKAAVAKSLKK